MTTCPYCLKPDAVDRTDGQPWCYCHRCRKPFTPPETNQEREDRLRLERITEMRERR